MSPQRRALEMAGEDASAAERARLGFELGALRPVADDDQRRAGARGGVDQPVDALLRGETAEIENVSSMRGADRLDLRGGNRRVAALSKKFGT